MERDNYFWGKSGAGIVYCGDEQRRAFESTQPPDSRQSLQRQTEISAKPNHSETLHLEGPAAGLTASKFPEQISALSPPLNINKTEVLATSGLVGHLRKEPNPTSALNLFTNH